MAEFNEKSLEEIHQLAEVALGAGLSDGQRARWRELTADILELLSNISPTGSQRRRHLRAAAAITVEVLAPVERRVLVTSSIGGGGLAVPMTEAPPIGTRLQVAMHVAERDQPVAAEAEVVWHRPGSDASGPVEVGASFTRIEQRDRDLLEAVILERLTQALRAHSA